ncbi:major facilitator superfamily domain-containing protein [Circinella umbellata]|nr:major facilitator superfamily domain-containing protein [Circinella umbellata]
MTCTPRSDENDNELTVTQHTIDVDLEKGIAKNLMNKSYSLNNKEPVLNSLENIDTVEKDESTITDSSTDTLDDIPDGGYGWAVAAAGFLGYFVLMGVANLWGLFSQAYATSILKGKASTLELITIGSLIFVSLNIFSPLSVLLSRFGTRFSYGLGGFLMCLAIILAGFSTKVWHLYLTQGLLFGFGGSFLYMSIASVIPQWFTTRRATAMGISTAGSGLGALAMSPMVNFLIIKYGLPWAYRILGFFLLGICTIGTILIKDRIPPSCRKSRPLLKSPIQLSMFKIVNFDLWLIGSVVSLLGYLPGLFYLPKYAADIGLDQTDAANLLAILSAMNAVGRVGLGFIADKIGRLNMFIIISILSGLFSFVIWPLATSYNILLVFCILWGATSGMYYALAAPITASIVDVEKLASGLSITFIFSSIAAMGTPIAAVIQQITPNNGYIGVQIFSGSVYIIGSIICIILKYRLTGSLLAKF